MYKIVWFAIIGIAIVVNILNGSMKILGSNNWMGIEAIVGFIINISIIYLTIHLHRSERKDRIIEFEKQQKEIEKQQKQIDDQEKERDFDRQALMLQNRINLLAEREVQELPYEDCKAEDFIYDLIVEAIFFDESDEIIDTNSGLYTHSDKCYKAIDVRDPWFSNRQYFQGRRDECDILLSFFNDFHKYCLESNRDDLYWYLKLNSKFNNYLSRICFFNGSFTYHRGDWWFEHAVKDFYIKNLKTKSDFMNDPEIMKNQEFALENGTEYLIDSNDNEKDTLYLKPNDALDCHKYLDEYVRYKSEIYKGLETWMDYEDSCNKMREVMDIYHKAVK